MLMHAVQDKDADDDDHNKDDDVNDHNQQWAQPGTAR